MIISASSDVAVLRRFNRLYTAKLGLLDTHLDGSPFTLSEARVLYEIANRPKPIAAEIARSLNMDRAQISRTLKRFSDRKLIDVEEDPMHGRQQLLSLTAAGRECFADLNAKTERAIGNFLGRLRPFERERLLAASTSITSTLERVGEPPQVILRAPGVGDLGLVTARQAIVYAKEYGWNDDYEALVARILADFHELFDPLKDAAWIAELGGEIVGSIFLVHSESPETAKLRLLYVEPFARGLGIGALLIGACIEKARVFGYLRLTLWTNNVLVAARRLYERFGFQLVEEAPHHSFGHDLMGQTWSLVL